MSGEAWKWVLPNVELNRKENSLIREITGIPRQPSIYKKHYLSTDKTDAAYVMVNALSSLRGWPLLWHCDPPGGLGPPGRTWAWLSALPFSEVTDQRLHMHFALLLPFSLSVVSDSAAPWTVAHQAPLSMGFFRQECWSGLPCPSSGDLPDPEIEPTSPVSPALAGGFFAHWAIAASSDQKHWHHLRRF